IPSTPSVYTPSLHDALPISDHDHDVGTLQRRQFLTQRRHQGQVPGRQGRHPDHVHVGLHRLGGHLRRGLEQRTHVHVKTQIRKRDRKSTRLNSSHVSSSYAV